MNKPCADATLWSRNWMRSYENIRVSLRSLQLQAEEQVAGSRVSRAVLQMAPYFGNVDEAFDALNRSKPVKNREPGQKSFVDSAMDE